MTKMITRLYKPLTGTTSSLSVRRCLAIVAFVVIMLGSLAFNSSAMAQSANEAVGVQGIDRTEIAKELSQKHAENPVGMGLAKNGGIIELFSSPDGNTWTLIMTMPNGKSFLLGAGESWAGAPVILKGQKI
ncbi:MAG: hypothetical protein HN731_16540 [Rhodospirillaceae bacterium]|jgi:hypothetical protein|nr:hypothetical protein [Rhodospirillaceae bacterium]MBT7956805.1 hypothetical protein [Rhodospirillaceae bacterium]